jgi:hypothetical protein
MSAPQAYPWAGQPRTFLAVAMPNGEARFGVVGELVFLSERRAGDADKVKILSRAEAENLRDELVRALATFDHAAALCGAARPAPAAFPYRTHRTLAEVDAGAAGSDGIGQEEGGR